jgi:starch synthase
MPLRICLVAAETAPFAKVGGLADVTAALAKYLHAGGHDVRLFLPLYAGIRRAELALEPVPALQNLSLQLGPYPYQFSIATLPLPGSEALVYLVDCPACYDLRPIYTSDPDEHRRFLVLTHAAFVCCQYLGFAPEIMHFNDWHTAVGALLLRGPFKWDRLFQGARSVLTLHNIGYQGVVAAGAAPEVLAGASASMLDQRELAAGHINLLRTGIAHADLITTVSPTYAREIQTPEYGMGLDDLLRSRSAALVGILNGVDYDVWDPRRDPYLPHHYGTTRLRVKASLKEELLQRVGLKAPNAAGARIPLLGIVSRLVAQKGFDLLTRVLPPLLQRRELNLIVVGSGEPRYEEFFSELARRHPRRVHFYRGYSDELAHWTEAASDMFLMPSQYEPCGLNQMYSLRYGSVPIVRRTGGLADSVQQFNPATRAGTGFLFDDYAAEALSTALDAALDLYQREEYWLRLMRNGMAKDFSWRTQVQRYVEVYQRLLPAPA